MLPLIEQQVKNEQNQPVVVKTAKNVEDRDTSCCFFLVSTTALWVCDVSYEIFVHLLSGDLFLLKFKDLFSTFSKSASQLPTILNFGFNGSGPDRSVFHFVLKQKEKHLCLC